MTKFNFVILVLTSVIVFTSSSPIEGINGSDSESSDDGCVYIEDCEPLFWILKNMNGMENKTSEDVSDILK